MGILQELAQRSQVILKNGGLAVLGNTAWCLVVIYLCEMSGLVREKEIVWLTRLGF